MKTIGIILAIIGLLMIIFTSFNFKTKEKIIDAGPIEINKEKSHEINWPPILGGILLAGGVVIIAMDKKKIV
ncbi:MAG: hypothetical protein ABIT08_16190 [Bacteroidia bacterium]